MRFGTTMMILASFIAAASTGRTASAETFSREDTIRISTEGVRSIRFHELENARLIYRGMDGVTDLSIVFKPEVEASDSEEGARALESMAVDAVRTGDAIDVRLLGPESGSFFRTIFGKNDWKTRIEVTGPSLIDISADTGKSNADFMHTRGSLSIEGAITNVSITGHTGRLDLSLKFCECTVNGLAGSFGADIEFGSGDIMIDRLDGDSSVRTRFSGVTIDLPRDTGADFHISKSMGDIDFGVEGPLSGSDDAAIRILGNGGHTIDIDTVLGSVNVRNSRAPAVMAERGVRWRSDAVMPLVEGAWWRYESDGGVSTMRVEDVSAPGDGRCATLVFSGASPPFSRIGVCEDERGLSVRSIEGPFFGRDLGGVTFDPPRLWLPYGDTPDVRGDGLLGSARRLDTEDDGVLDFGFGEGFSPPGTTLTVGVGFTSFGDGVTMVAYDLGSAPGPAGAPETLPDRPAPEPFERGILRTITVHGNRMLEEDHVLSMLDLETGREYTCDEIKHEVELIPTRTKLISSASCTIDADGNLRVFVYEAKLYTLDTDLAASYSRVAGVGLGLDARVTSIIGPVSAIGGGAQYHWATEEWTSHAMAEKSFFTSNRLTVGGTYRYAYESATDWLIPDKDSYLNSFLWGLETKNYYQVEGASGYISQSFDDNVKLTAEYYDEEFDSLKKHTNYSLFNHRHVKEDNPPLADKWSDRITGMRFRLNIQGGWPIMNGALRLMLDRSFDKGADALPAYTCVLGDFAYTSRVSYAHLLKVRLAGGWSDDELPDQRAFRLGGINTLRGFDPGDMPVPPAGMDGFDYHAGGNRMFLANIDYFIGSRDDAKLVVFGDAGAAWFKGDAATFSDLKRDVGVGLVFSGDFFPLTDLSAESVDTFRVNWAVPVGDEPHVSRWTVNFVRAY